MRTYDLDGSSGCIATVFDEDVFTREENYIRLHRNDQNVPIVAVNGQVYNFYDDDLDIEVSDLLRTLPQTGGIILDFNGRTTGVTYKRWDGVSFASNVVLPPPKLQAVPYTIGAFNIAIYYNSGFSSAATVTIYKLGGSPIGTKAQGVVGDSVIPRSVGDMSYGVVFPSINVQEIAPEVLERYNFEPVTGGYMYKIDVVSLECDREYASVRWTGRNGLIKEWFWEKVSRDTAANSVITLGVPDNRQRLIKRGYAVTLPAVCRDLDTLTFDYLSDIVESNDVQIYNELSQAWESYGVSDSRVSCGLGKADINITFTLKTYLR